MVSSSCSSLVIACPLLTFTSVGHSASHPGSTSGRVTRTRRLDVLGQLGDGGSFEQVTERQLDVEHVGHPPPPPVPPPVPPHPLAPRPSSPPRPPRPPHGGVPPQPPLDPRQLDPKPPHFPLVVDPPQNLDTAIGHIPPQTPRLVQPRPA